MTISLSGFCDNNINNYGIPEEYGADHNINIACHPSINKYYFIVNIATIKLELMEQERDAYMEKEFHICS